MNHLLRSHAPITDDGWQQLEHEIQQRVVPALAARRLVDFSGPHGWTHSATNLGRVAAITAPRDGLRSYQRKVLPVAELRADFSVSRDELRDIDRGAANPDLGELDGAARRIAEAENVAVFHGWPAAGIVGIAEGEGLTRIALGEDVELYPRHVAKAVETLLSIGISGPYGLALGPDGYTSLVETTEHGGLIVFDHIRQILGGQIVWAPGVQGAVVLSLRGGDFVFEVGQDLSLGYDHHDAEHVHLYLEESFTFLKTTPEAAVVLTP
jgi:uncharacterized linocin/CFP29 family protein